jgi:cadherin 5 type 2 (VE-cadherin)
MLVNFVSIIFPDQDNTPIVVGVTVPLVLLVLFKLVVVIHKRRFSSRKATETRGNDNLSLPDSIIETR